MEYYAGIYQRTEHSSWVFRSISWAAHRSAAETRGTRRDRSEFVSSSEPFGVGDSRIELVRCLVALERAIVRGARGLGEESPYLFGRHRPEGPSGVDGLFEDLHGVAARDDAARGQVHRVVQSLDGTHGVACRDLTISERLHPEDSDPLLHKDRQNPLFEALEVGVHHVQRHLDRVEPEAMICCRLEHPQMNRGTLVSRESDIADPPRVLRLERRLDRAALGEDPTRILHPDDLVELQEVDDVRLEPSERLLDLPGGRRPRLSVDFGHQEGSLPVSVPEGLSHADLAPPVVVVPGVVEEIDARVDRGAQDANALRFPEVWLAEVEPAEADRGDALSGAAERAHGDAAGDRILRNRGRGLPQSGNR